MTQMHGCLLSGFSCVRLIVTLQTIVCQAPLSMGFSRQGYCRRLPFPPSGDRPHLGIESASLAVFYVGKDGRMCASSVMSGSFQPYGL